MRLGTKLGSWLLCVSWHELKTVHAMIEMKRVHTHSCLLARDLFTQPDARASLSWLREGLAGPGTNYISSTNNQLLVLISQSDFS